MARSSRSHRDRQRVASKHLVVCFWLESRQMYLVPGQIHSTVESDLIRTLPEIRHNGFLPRSKARQHQGHRSHPLSVLNISAKGHVEFANPHRQWSTGFIKECRSNGDRHCGLVVRVPGYRSRGPGFDSQRYKIFLEVMGLERGPLSLVRIIEELLEWKSSGSGLVNQS
jgi:hypothetical protein